MTLIHYIIDIILSKYDITQIHLYLNFLDPTQHLCGLLVGNPEIGELPASIRAPYHVPGITSPFRNQTEASGP